MEKQFTKNRIEQIIREGYGLSFDGVFSQSFEIYKRSFFSGVVATLFYLLSIGFVLFFMFEYMYGMSLTEMIKTVQTNPETVETTLYSIQTSSKLLNAVVMALAMALVAPLISGIFNVSYKTKYEEGSSVSDLFSYYRQPYFLNIFLYSFFFSLVMQLPNIYLEQVMPVFGGLLFIVIQIFLGVSLILTIPLIVFGKLSWVEAFQASYKIIIKNWFNIFFILLISGIIAVGGIFLCCIGFLFSYPFLFIVNFTLYDEIIGFYDYDEIADIGGN